jgi:hypothetical protein
VSAVEASGKTVLWPVNDYRRPYPEPRLYGCHHRPVNAYTWGSNS